MSLISSRVSLETDRPSMGNSRALMAFCLTVSMEENYGRRAEAYLPIMEFSGIEFTVVQIADEATDEIIYTVRVEGSSFRPKVFSKGTFTIIVGEPGTDQMKTLKSVKSLEEGKEETLQIDF